MREARQQFSDKKLKTLIKVLNQLDDEDDDTSLHKLCREVQLSAEQLKLHHRYADHFRSGFETYYSGVVALQNECSEKVRDGVLVELRKLNFKKGREPSLTLIQNIAMKLPVADRQNKNNYGTSWAKGVRLLYRKAKINRKNMRNNQSKKFLIYIEWLAKYMKTHDRISYVLSKQKHVEIIGIIKSQRAWSCFSRRVRTRLNLEYFKDKSKPLGDLQHFWIKK